MKLLTIVAIVLCAHGTYSFSASSLRIEAEIRRSMMGLDTVFSMEANNITECIQNRSESYFLSYEVLRDDVTVMLETLGPRGELFSHILEKDANDIIESLKKKFNSAVLQSRVVGGIRAVQKKFSDDLLKEVRILQAAVDENENAITCWDNNKGTLRNIFMNVFVQGREATYVNLAHLDARIEKVVKKIDDAIARIGKQLLEVCGYKSQCILSYFDQSYPAVLREFQGYRDVAVENLHKAISSLFKDLIEIFSSSSKKYQAVKSTIAQCLENA